MLRVMMTVWMVLAFTGCDLVDKAKDKYDELKEKYLEKPGEDRGERPFQVIYQNPNGPKSVLISSGCGSNAEVGYAYFPTQSDAAYNYFKKTRYYVSRPGSIKPFWDIRYTNPVNAYIRYTDSTYYPNHARLTGLDARSGRQNVEVGTAFAQRDPTGVVVQSECVGGQLAGGALLNLFDAPAQHLVYAGIAHTFTYQFDVRSHIRPWHADGSGNLAIQASFDRPIYRRYGDNIGASTAFNVMLYNPKLKKHLNYVIGLHAAGSAWLREKSGIKFDPSTNIVHVATVVSPDSWWCTIAPGSQSITEVHNSSDTRRDDGVWPEFFRVNISYQNLLATLNELIQNPPPNVAGQQFGQSPQDWEVILIGIQYELADEGGKALYAGSFRGFEAYLSPLPF